MNSPLHSRLRLSVLDQSVALAGRPQADSIRETLALAELAESLGYHRFWVSEHHSHPTIVGSAPEVLMAAIAARTQRIRIGSAGVMLPHYAPLKVAEQFRVLDALAPGRIDLGVGRAPGSDGRTAQLLNPDRNAAENFPRQVLELQAWLDEANGGDGLPSGHPGHGIHAYPHGPTAPALWMLGSSNYGAQLAAHYGLPYAFAYFITDGQGAAEALEIYRSMFRPSAALSAPQATLCVWALAADTEAEARHLFQSRARFKLDRHTGRLGPLMAPDDAARGLSPAQEAQRETIGANALVGSSAQVADQLHRLAAAHEVDELVVITWTHDPEARRRSYTLLAQQFELTELA